jgi:hypothetical protein
MAGWRQGLLVSFFLCGVLGCGKKDEAQPPQPVAEEVKSVVEPEAEPDEDLPAEEPAAETVLLEAVLPPDTPAPETVATAHTAVGGFLRYVAASRKDRHRLPMVMMCLGEKDRVRASRAGLRKDNRGRVTGSGPLSAAEILAVLGAPSLDESGFALGDVRKVGERLAVDVVLRHGPSELRKRFYLSRVGFKWQVDFFLSAFGGDSPVPEAAYQAADRVYNADLLMDVIHILADTQDPAHVKGFERALLMGMGKAGNEEAEAAILAQMDRVPLPTRLWFVRALGARGKGAEARAKLVALIGDENDELSHAAFAALTAWKETEAAEPLLAAVATQRERHARYLKENKEAREKAEQERVALEKAIEEAKAKLAAEVEKAASGKEDAQKEDAQKEGNPQKKEADVAGKPEADQAAPPAALTPAEKAQERLDKLSARLAARAEKIKELDAARAQSVKAQAAREAAALQSCLTLAEGAVKTDPARTLHLYRAVMDATAAADIRKKAVDLTGKMAETHAEKAVAALQAVAADDGDEALAKHAKAVLAAIEKAGAKKEK